ncbi:MAG: di-heme oxidoredictase family protein [Chloroflexota bacterium]|nr:di-heme oxidoredictase family protein [Chloroflexota bacterium]
MMPNRLIVSSLIGTFLIIGCGFNLSDPSGDGDFVETIGDAPSISVHIDQEDILSNKLSVEEILRKGEILFLASFNSLDGAGRPETNGDFDSRERREIPDNFNRISGPDANACSGCHNLPKTGGGGDNVANVFVLSGELSFVEDMPLSEVGNERNTLGMFGSGYVELLAREITDDLEQIRYDAFWKSKITKEIIRVQLISKGIDFGFITVHPNGVVDTSETEGIDEDLIIKPFGQKGSMISLRQFTIFALNLHHGIQAAETYGFGKDPDKDGIPDELSVGDITALTLFQAALPAPSINYPESDQAKEAALLGENIFETIGCASCHIPKLPLESSVFVEPNPYNPPRIYREESGASPFSIDLIKLDSNANFETDSDGRIMIPVFTDFKRHDMGDQLDNEKVGQCERSNSGRCFDIPSSQWLTKKLWGFASEPPFLHHGRATLISQAIEAHGGEAEESRVKFQNLAVGDQKAVVEFLKSLRIR